MLMMLFQEGCSMHLTPGAAKPIKRQQYTAHKCPICFSLSSRFATLNNDTTRTSHIESLQARRQAKSMSDIDAPSILLPVKRFAYFVLLDGGAEPESC